MYCEMELIRRGMILNITLEELVEDLAERSGCDEIRQFSAVLSVAKRGGGNISQIIRTSYIQSYGKRHYLHNSLFQTPSPE